MNCFSHILNGFSLGFSHRSTLRLLLDHTPVNSGIMGIDPGALSASGITVLALDFDGVLAHHGSVTPLPEAIEWIQRCETALGSGQIFILSNKPTEYRRAWFDHHFPGIRFISGVPKKPFPDGLYKIGELSGAPLSSILMVDDRLLTGCLAAINAGSRPHYIRKPYICFAHHPVAEIFFMLLRKLERAYIRSISSF